VVAGYAVGVDATDLAVVVDDYWADVVEGVESAGDFVAGEVVDFEVVGLEVVACELLWGDGRVGEGS